MQHDEVIWQVIRHNHCSFMTKITTGNFCRNPYNVTGICNRSSCPLANSRYATIRDHEGRQHDYTPWWFVRWPGRFGGTRQPSRQLDGAWRRLVGGAWRLGNKGFLLR
ncbi:hypothetical protein RHMOL_Rhmol12G0129600 [Rhododendron molle]|uniref:Uncharacterized protein n=1 Tax=Rhododendron molle TaxID=49168 RepID=A0ACC0LIE0_RHOML|nr:hypothetical protein RHMOL_Rhmol12G0129600 [Rhododendron molle]